jgi:hypothetical protein
MINLSYLTEDEKYSVLLKLPQEREDQTWYIAGATEDQFYEAYWSTLIVQSYSDMACVFVDINKPFEADGFHVTVDGHTHIFVVFEGEQKERLKFIDGIVKIIEFQSPGAKKLISGYYSGPTLSANLLALKEAGIGESENLSVHRPINREILGVYNMKTLDHVYVDPRKQDLAWKFSGRISGWE